MQDQVLALPNLADIEHARAHLETAPDQVDPLAHPNQAKPAARANRGDAGRRNTASVVGDGENHLVPEVQIDSGVRGMCVAYYVAQSLLGHPVYGELALVREPHLISAHLQPDHNPVPGANLCDQLT